VHQPEMTHQTSIPSLFISFAVQHTIFETFFLNIPNSKKARCSCGLFM
jgi:hypothetical protein